MSVVLPPLLGSPLLAQLLLKLPPGPALRPDTAGPTDRVTMPTTSAPRQLEALLPVLDRALRNAATRLEPVALGHLAQAIGVAARTLLPTPQDGVAPHEPIAPKLHAAAELLGRAEQVLRPPNASADHPAPQMATTPHPVAFDPAAAAWALAQIGAARGEIAVALRTHGQRSGSRAPGWVGAGSAGALASSLSLLGILLGCCLLLLGVGAWTAAAVLGSVAGAAWTWRRLRIELR